jgi:putative two-component system response regulator
MLNNLILCVDDDPINLSLLRNTLHNYKLVFARNGAEALAVVLKHSPALILLDVQMPDMTGFEVAQRLKSNPKTEHIPIIFVTSLLDEDDEQAGFDVGGVDYITKPISPCIVRARVQTHLSLVRASKLDASYRDAIYMLGDAGHYNDTDTGVHIWRMAAYCHALALAAGWEQDYANLLEMAAPMHDTGKIGMPDAILQKSSKLSPEEWIIMKRHSLIGYDILSKSNAPVFKLAAEIALNHHERWDGNGYPNGISGEAIPESARIVAIADVFDALSMRRPYKEPWPMERILPTLQQLAGNHLDKRLVTIFLGIMPRILEIKAEWNSRSSLDSFAQ